MAQEVEVRKLFLQQFMREVVMHAVPVPHNGSQEAIAAEETLSASAFGEKTPIHAPSLQPFKKALPVQPRPQQPTPRFSPRSLQQPLPYAPPALYFNRRPLPPKVYLAPPTESWIAGIESLKRIQPLLADPTITTIECPGPGMPIMIARGTYVQSTPVHFTAEEISKIIQDISARTKIPLTASGLFKAAIGDSIITALLSEFVGTRFVIQKKPKSPSLFAPPRRR